VRSIAGEMDSAAERGLMVVCMRVSQGGDFSTAKLIAGRVAYDSKNEG